MPSAGPPSAMMLKVVTAGSSDVVVVGASVVVSVVSSDVMGVVVSDSIEVDANETSAVEVSMVPGTVVLAVSVDATPDAVA